MTHLVFRDSLEAALGLADALEAYKQIRASVLAVSCASLPMGRLIADALGAQLRLAGLPAEWASASWHEVIPSRRERAESSMPFGSPEEAACEADLEDVQRAILAKAQAHRRRCGICSSAGLAQRTVIVLDDGSATPSAIASSLRMVRVYGPTLLVYAAPVTTMETLTQASVLADTCIYLAATDSVNAVAAHFLDYPVVTDRQAMRALFPTAMRWGEGDGTCPGCLSVGKGMR